MSAMKCQHILKTECCVDTSCGTCVVTRPARNSLRCLLRLAWSITQSADMSAKVHRLSLHRLGHEVASNCSVATHHARNVHGANFGEEF